MTHPALLDIINVTRPGLNPVNLSVAAGDIIAIGGPSGSGKSLLLRALADLDPNDGRVLLDGTARDALPAPDWRKRVAYVPAESGWWEDTVAPHMIDPVRATAMAVRLGLGETVMGWSISRLSTGEKQRLALIRALETAPRVLLLDEPTSGLDPRAAENVEALIRETCAQGVAALVVSHDGAQAARLGARAVYHMENGTLRQGEPTP